MTEETVVVNTESSFGEGRYSFWVIPDSACRRCHRAYRQPVALAGGFPNVVVRYVCPDCRLVSDVRWTLQEGDTYGPFDDRFVQEREGLESHQRGEGLETKPHPAGPSDIFKKGGDTRHGVGD